MLKIQPQYLSLSKLLSGRLFRIPEYQRAYSWTSHQRDDLFDDLRKAHAKGKDGDHFMAAVVCLRKDMRELGTDEYQVLEVVDGQQRLTTLIILLNTLQMRLDPESDQAKLATELEGLLVKPDSGGELLLLQTNHDSSHYFADFLRRQRVVEPSEATTTADLEILKAISECGRFVDRWVASGNDLIALGSLLKNRLHFLLHEIGEEGTVYTVFEVLNSRGLTVSWLDRLKSILMGIAYDLPKVDQTSLIKDLHVAWRDIYASIGLRQGLSTEALRFAATLAVKHLAPSRPLGEEESVEELRRHASSGAEQLRSVASWVLDVTRACDVVLANHRLNAVSRISQARLLATAIQLRTDFSDDERDAVLATWEKVTFRIYGMLRRDSRTRVGDYVRLAWRVVNEKPSSQKIREEIIQIGHGFPITDAVAALSDADCYEGWGTELRYFMFKYEQYLCQEQGMRFSKDQWDKIWMASPSDSIEHVLPQSVAPDHLMHRLGNLVLLSPNLNSSLKNKPPIDKVDAYVKTGLLVASEVASQIESNKRWGEIEINEREKSLLRWAEFEWAD